MEEESAKLRGFRQREKQVWILKKRRASVRHSREVGSFRMWGSRRDRGRG